MVEPKASPTDEIRPRLEHERLSRSSFPSRIFSRGRVSRGQRDRLLALMSPVSPWLDTPSRIRCLGEQLGR